MSRHVVSARQFGALFDPEQGGFSVNEFGESPTSGYMVSRAGTERQIPAAVIHPHDLQRYAQEHQGELKGRNRFFGGWNDVGRVDLDVSENLPSGGPVEKAGAHMAMIHQNQKALYNVDKGTLEFNQFYGLTPEQAHAAIKSKYEEARGRS